MRYIISFLFLALAFGTQAQNKLSLYFKTNEWKLNNTQQLLIDSFLSKYPLAYIEAHTDSVGDSSYNILLSEKRAKAVQERFSHTRAKSEGMFFYGENKPLSLEKNNPDKNRRVDLFEKKQPDKKDPSYIQSLDDLYMRLSQKPQVFCINNNRDTLIKGKEGTLIYIKANTFNNKSTDCINIRLKERYKKSLIVGDNLTTITTQNQVLISQAMFEIDSDKELYPDKNIVVLAPADTIILDLKTFYGDRDSNDIMHWRNFNGDLSSGSLSRLFGFNGSPCLRYITITSCGFFCRVLDATGIKKYKPVTIRDTIPCAKAEDAPRYLDSLSAEQFRNMQTDSMKYYVFNTRRLGWMNLDWLMKIKEKTDYKVHIKPEKDLDIKLVFKKYRSIVPLFPGKDHYYFDGLPPGYEAWLVAFKVQEGKAYVAIEPITIDALGKSGLKLEEVSPDELYERLKVFDN